MKNPRFYRGVPFFVDSALGFWLRSVTEISVKHTDLARVQKIVEIKMGKHIHDYANGIDPSPVLAEPE